MYVDVEFEKASAADEKEIYYYLYTCSGGRIIKKYKPSVAELLTKRDKQERVPVELIKESKMSIDEAVKVLKKDVKCIEEDGYKCIETNIDCRDCEFWVTPDERREANRTLVDYFKNENKED